MRPTTPTTPRCGGFPPRRPGAGGGAPPPPPAGARPRPPPAGPGGVGGAGAASLGLGGRLARRAGGPGVVVPVDADLVKLLYAPSQWAVTPDAREHDRRSVYLVARRNLRLPFLESFDQPDAQTSC